ncbi:hypothetical protein [Flavobacterium sp. 1]|uniref:hypothetical protein n=1 Tax=Flavobacterium sp. 1 TaxID=2035200 RepID=UPI001E4FA879|nr:hypothetical protein [Flavobacterium sp. 1]
MKRFLIAVILISNLHYHSSWGQEAHGVEDFKPSSVNQPGKQFPQVNSQGRVRASILALNASKVQPDIGGTK